MKKPPVLVSLAVSLVVLLGIVFVVATQSGIGSVPSHAPNMMPEDATAKLKQTFGTVTGPPPPGAQYISPANGRQ